jgi:hypothetical protein
MSVFYPAGRYRVRIISAALGESNPKADGTTTPQIEVGIEILGLYDQGELRQLAGPPRTIFLSLTDATLGTSTAPGWVWQTLIDLGFAGKSFAELAPLVGKDRDGECRHDDFTGEAKEKWSIYRQARGAQRPAEQKTIRSIDSKFKDLLRTAARPGPAVAPAAPTAPPGPTNNRRPAPRPPTPPPEPEPDDQPNDPIPF